MKQTVLSVIIILTSVYTFGQSPIAPIAGGHNPVALSKGIAINEIKLEPAPTKGNFYMYDEWRKGNIYLKTNEKIENYPLKYDLEKNLIEININDTVKVLPSARVEMFEWVEPLNNKKSVYIRGDFYKNNPLVGFHELLTSGKMQLLSKINLEIIKSNYNAAMNVGEKSDQIVKKEKLYMAKEEEIWEVKKNKKDILQYFGEKAQVVEEYAKTNNLSFKNKEDLIKIVNYYNTSM